MRFLTKLARFATVATVLFTASLAYAKETIIVIVGDSTVASYLKPDDVNRGWGQILSDWSGGETKVINLAKSGASSKSFLSRGLWAKALKAKPNVVLIQFGHNDRARDEARGTKPDEYAENLRRYVTESRAIGAEPIFVTPPVPRVFNAETGKLGNGKLIPYVEAMKKVGEEEKVPVLDLFARSSDWYRSIGKEKSIEFAPRPTDINHYNQAGAEQLARFILEEAKEKAPQLNQLFAEPAK